MTAAVLRRPTLAAGLSVAATIVVLAFVLRGVPRATAGGDAAMTELYTLHASQGPWLHGAYSRFGWHHPGPMLFYLYAPWYALTGRHPAAINASAILINVVAVATMVWVIARRRDDALAWSVLAALAIFVWRFGGVVSSGWNPHVLILPFAAVLITAAAVAAGETAMILPMVIAGSLVAQAHLGLVPVSAVTMAIAIGAALTGHRRSDGFRRSMLLTASVAVVLWLPAIVEALSHAPGNPARIYSFFASANAPAGPDPWLPLWAWADLVTAMWSGDPLVQPGEIYRPAGGGVALAMALLQTLLLPIVGWWALGTGRTLHGWLAIIVMAASVTALVALQRQWSIEGAILVHTSLWVVPIGMLNLAVIAAAVAAFAAPAVPPNVERMFTRAFAPCCAAALALLVVWGGYQFHRLRENTLRAARHPTDTDRIVENTARYLRERRLGHPLVIVDAPVWYHTAAVVIDLARSGVDVAVQPELQSMFGAPLVKQTRRDVTIRIVDRAGAAALEAQPMRELVLARDSVWVFALPPISPVP